MRRLLCWSAVGADAAVRTACCRPWPRRVGGCSWITAPGAAGGIRQTRRLPAAERATTSEPGGSPTPLKRLVDSHGLTKPDPRPRPTAPRPRQGPHVEKPITPVVVPATGRRRAAHVPSADGDALRRLLVPWSVEDDLWSVPVFCAARHDAGGRAFAHHQQSLQKPSGGCRDHVIEQRRLTDAAPSASAVVRTANSRFWPLLR